MSAIDKLKLLTYLRLSEKHLGLLINFHVELLRDGIERVVNKLPEETIKKLSEALRPLRLCVE
jgi:hypothetical protein